MNWKRITLFACLFCIPHVIGFAATSKETNDKLIKALEFYYNNQFDEATPLFEDVYQTLQSKDVMFWFGSSAYKSGDCALGINVLKNLLKEDPGQYRVRYELGAAYLECGQQANAHAEFRTVLSQNPPDIVKQKIKNLLAGQTLIVEKLSWTVSASVGGQYDSNVNSGPSDAVTDTRAEIELDDDSKELDGTNILANFNGTLLYDIGETNNWLLNTTCSINNSTNSDDSSYDFVSMDASCGLNWIGDNTVVKIPVGFTYVYYSREPLTQNLSLNPGIDYFFQDDLSFNLTYRVSQERYEDSKYVDEGYDNIDHSIKMGPSLYFDNKKHTLTGTIGYALHGADKDEQSYNTMSASLMYFVQFKTNTDVLLSYEFMQREYDGITEDEDERVYDTVREDTRHSVTFQITQRFLEYGFATLEGTYTTNDSNQALYAFDKLTGSLSVGITF